MKVIKSLNSVNNKSTHFEFDNGFNADLHYGQTLRVRGPKGGLIKVGTPNWMKANAAIANYDLAFELALDSLLSQQQF